MYNLAPSVIVCIPDPDPRGSIFVCIATNKCSSWLSDSTWIHVPVPLSVVIGEPGVAGGR